MSKVGPTLGAMLLTTTSFRVLTTIAVSKTLNKCFFPNAASPSTVGLHLEIKFHTSSVPTKTTKKMVTLIVATTTDPASINPANALLAMPGWDPTTTTSSVQEMKGFGNGDGGVRVLLHNRGIVEEDDLDRRWEEATGERVDEVIFLSKHTAVSNRPALTVHPIGVPHLRPGEAAPQGGRPGWAALPCPRIGPWLRHLKKLAQAHNLVPEFEV